MREPNNPQQKTFYVQQFQGKKKKKKDEKNQTHTQMKSLSFITSALRVKCQNFVCGALLLQQPLIDLEF